MLLFLFAKTCVVKHSSLKNLTYFNFSKETKLSRQSLPYSNFSFDTLRSQHHHRACSLYPQHLKELPAALILSSSCLIFLPARQTPCTASDSTKSCFVGEVSASRSNEFVLFHTRLAVQEQRQYESKKWHTLLRCSTFRRCVKKSMLHGEE